MTRRTVLITGASGFIGRAVTAVLLQDEGLEVHSAGRTAPDCGAGHGAEHQHQCDLLDSAQRTRLIQSVRPDLLIHSAWYAQHGKFWTARENLAWVGATLDLASLLQQAGGTRFVGVGSCAEYTWGSPENLHEQTSPLEPSTLYGVAKDATRRVLQSFARNCELDWAWVRLFMVYGPGEASTRLFPSIAMPLLHRENASCSAGDQLRDFLHVDDVGRGIACAALSSVTGTINVASGRELRVGDFARQVAHEIGSSTELKLGALPMRDGDPARIVADTTLLSGLGFEPTYDLLTGVAKAVEALRQQDRTASK